MFTEARMATSNKGLATSAVRGIGKLLEDEVHRGGALSCKAHQLRIHGGNGKGMKFWAACHA